jgi:hypothetical protein
MPEPEIGPDGWFGSVHMPICFPFSSRTFVLTPLPGGRLLYYSIDNSGPMSVACPHRRTDSGVRCWATPDDSAIGTPMTTTDDKKPEQQLDYDAALWRLVYLSLGGCVVIVIYGAWSAHGLGVVGVGLMTAGAAMLSGGLLGFLFGVPHTREGEAAQAKVEEREEADGQQSKSVGGDSSPTYRPNTSLEQISDWLTKMLVGVGLIEIKVIPAKLKSIADYLAKGLGGTDQAQAFALTMLIYFSVCGFVFGFLWARLYLKKWFVESDRQEVKHLRWFSNR